MLVTGLGGTGAFWIKQMPYLSRDFRAITHDHRGAGQSTHSRITYSVEQMADDTLRLMDALHVDTAHFIGHSTGGAIGQVIALTRPQRLKSLVLSATWAGPDPYFRRVFESRKELLLACGVEAYHRASTLFLAPPWWISRNDAAVTQHIAQQVLASAPVEVIASRIDAIVRFDVRARLGEIRVPTLVIVAEDDMITPRFYAEELANGIPNAKLVVLDAGGHRAPDILADRFNTEVGDFLRAQR
jgi:aminoacrylate hydrolase